MSLSTPVAFIIFNRPDLTEQVFAAIAKAKPQKLLVIADGPRFPEEAENCKRARTVIDKVDWNCEVLTNFSKKNLGCKQRVSSGLAWVFSEVEEAIILEDDCLPSQSFFLYCQELLAYYRDEPKITSINGSNFGFYDPQEKFSYRYSKFMNMWGWATWRRAFNIVDFSMENWSVFKTSTELRKILGRDRRWINYWKNTFEKTYIGEIDTWDYQWIFSNLYHKGLVVSPSVNLIKNIGYRGDATHTLDENHNLAKLKNHEISFPLIHPHKIKSSVQYDNYIKCAWCGVCPAPPLSQRIRNKLKRIIFKQLTVVSEKSFTNQE
jgi:hypothetical protein